MKTSLYILLLCLGLFAATFAQAQLYSGTSQTPAEREKVKLSREEYWRKTKEAHVAAMSIETQDYKRGVAKCDLHLAIKTHYNQFGQSTAQEIHVKNGKLWQTSESEYDAAGNIIAQSYKNRKGNYTGRKTMVYDGTLLQVTRNFSGKKDHCKSQSEYAYDASGRLIEVKTNNPLREKMINRTVYTYHEDGSKMRSELYDRKGKLATVVDYSCDAAGKTYASAKEELRTVCERFEKDAEGKTIRIVETLVGEKYEYRSIAKYDNTNHLLERTSYNQAGEIIGQFLYTYNDRGHMLTSERRVKGGKVDFRSVYEHNDKGLAISELRTDGDGVITSKLRYTYSYY